MHDFDTMIYYPNNANDGLSVDYMSDLQSMRQEEERDLVFKRWCAVV